MAKVNKTRSMSKSLENKPDHETSTIKKAALGELYNYRSRHSKNETFSAISEIVGRPIEHLKEMTLGEILFVGNRFAEVNAAYAKKVEACANGIVSEVPETKAIDHPSDIRINKEGSITGRLRGITKQRKSTDGWGTHDGLTKSEQEDMESKVPSELVEMDNARAQLLQEISSIARPTTDRFRPKTRPVPETRLAPGNFRSNKVDRYLGLDAAEQAMIKHMGAEILGSGDYGQAGSESSGFCESIWDDDDVKSKIEVKHKRNDSDVRSVSAIDSLFDDSDDGLF